jgi:hypothetical protein
VLLRVVAVVPNVIHRSRLPIEFGSMPVSKAEFDGYPQHRFCLLNAKGFNYASLPSLILALKDGVCARRLSISFGIRVSITRPRIDWCSPATPWLCLFWRLGMLGAIDCALRN